MLKREPRRAIRIALKELQRSFLVLKETIPCQPFSDIHTALGKTNNCIMILVQEITGR